MTSNMDESFEISPLDESVHEEEVTTTPSVYSCQSCSYTTRYKQNLKRHETNHQAKPGIDVGQSAKYMCDHGGHAFKSQVGLKSHVRSKHEHVFRFRCQTCGKGFQGLWNYRGHLSSHNKALKEKCAFCPQTFTHKSTLLSHQKRHDTLTARPADICNVCGIEFSDKKNLTEHKRGCHGGKL